MWRGWRKRAATLNLSTMHEQRKAIVGLDLVRFAAAALVMLYHLGVATWAVGDVDAARIVSGRASYPELFSIGWLGWIGVEIFFVLSGFVIAYSANGSSPFIFLRSRFLRLYPAAWICASITAATALSVNLVRGPKLLHEWLASVALWPFPPWVDSVYWTLGIEMAFYTGIFCLLCADRFRRVEVAAATLGSLSAAYWLIGSAMAPHFLEAHLWTRWLNLSPLPYGCYFALGTVLWVGSMSGWTSKRAAIAAICVLASAVEIGQKSNYNNQVFGSAEPMLVPLAAFGFALALIVSAVMFERGRLQRIAPLGRALGLATYPLYLLHDLVGAAVMSWLLSQGLNRWPALIASAIACLGLSLAVALCAEPLIRRAVRAALDWFEHERPVRLAFLFSATQPVAGGKPA